MDLIILDKNLSQVDIVDSYESLIWTDKYCDYGDFEIYTYAKQEVIDKYKQDYYLWFKDSEHIMIIEKLEISSDAENGNHLLVTGRSLESILKRRIVWTQTNISGNLQNGVKKLLDDAIINPSDVNRKINNFIFEESTDPAVTSLELDAQYTGDNLFDVIVDILKPKDLGFKITLNSDNQFVFKIYSGVDRSYQQNKNPYVIFSPKFENIINSNYINSLLDFKNVTLIAGEGEGSDRKTQSIGSVSGIERRELFTDARDISSTTESGGTIPIADYNKKLIQRGTEKLDEYKIEKIFEGEVEATQLFKYKEDFYLGDVVQVVNEYNMEHRSRVVAFIHSADSKGYAAYPTFDILEDEGE